MPGLKQAGRIANDRLKSHLAHFGITPFPRTPAIWKHATKLIVVHDFGVKYISKENTDYLIQALQKLYTISINWTGSLFCGLTITWYYDAHTYDISMTNYLQSALHKF